MLYLDHAATTPMRPEAWAAMEPFAGELFGNPSGLHQVSQSAKNHLEDARERAAALLGAARPLEIVFTGGGTEADNLAVTGAALAGDGVGGVITVATEHEAVLESAHFVQRLGGPVAVVGVDGHGRVDPEEVAAAVTAATRVVSVMAANNETGVIQLVAEVAAAARAANPNVLIHTDAVQAFISEDVTVESTRADLISLAAHKLGGPKGVGLLYVRDGVELEPVLHGGGQELGRRSGTHNPMGVAAMVAAMEVSARERSHFRERVGSERDAFEQRLADLVPGLEINAPRDARLAQHSHVRVPGVAAETMLIRLDGEGICAATGSACQSGAVEISHVLAAMGMSAAAAGECLRFTFGWTTSTGEGEQAAEVVAKLAAELGA